MNINQLRYFVALAETRSFTKAAEQYYISQTAITQQIRTLEGMVGCDLIDRSTRPIDLTPAGSVFLMEAKAILERMNKAMMRTREAATGLVGSLRIGYTKGYERSGLSDQLRTFHQQFPNVLVSCYREDTDKLAAGLLDGEYDMIFTWDSTNLKADEAIDSRLVEKARLVVAVYPAHSLAQRSSVSREELRSEKLLYMSPSSREDSFGDARFLELYREAGYQPDILFRSSDTESILMMVAAEEGISILPEYCTNKLFNADNLVFIPLEGENETEQIDAIWRRDNANPALQQMIEGYL